MKLELNLLPPEVLSYIFYLALLQKPTDYANLICVCRYHKSIATDATLWLRLFAHKETLFGDGLYNYLRVGSFGKAAHIAKYHTSNVKKLNDAQVTSIIEANCHCPEKLQTCLEILISSTQFNTNSKVMCSMNSRRSGDQSYSHILVMIVKDPKLLELYLKKEDIDLNARVETGRYSYPKIIADIIKSKIDEKGYEDAKILFEKMNSSSSITFPTDR